MGAGEGLEEPTVVTVPGAHGRSDLPQASRYGTTIGRRLWWYTRTTRNASPVRW